MTLCPARALRRHQVQAVRNGAFSQNIDYVAQVQGILNIKAYQNCIIGWKVTAVLLKGWILPVGGVAFGRVFACSRIFKTLYYSRIVTTHPCTNLGALKESLLCKPPLYIAVTSKTIFQFKKFWFQNLLVVWTARQRFWFLALTVSLGSVSYM